jgi:hypothetical protein
MPAKKNTRRSSRSKSQRVKLRSQRAKPRLDQEAIDDQKFQEKIDRELFIERIEREANDALLCPGCFNANWKMHHKYWISITENSLLATMICRKCKRKLPFATQLEPDEEEEDEGERAYYPFGGGARRRRRGLDIDQRIRLLHFL